MKLSQLLFSLAAVFSVLVYSCGSPLDIDTPRLSEGANKDDSLSLVFSSVRIFGNGFDISSADFVKTELKMEGAQMPYQFDIHVEVRPDPSRAPFIIYRTSGTTRTPVLEVKKYEFRILGAKADGSSQSYAGHPVDGSGLTATVRDLRKVNPVDTVVVSDNNSCKFSATFSPNVSADGYITANVFTLFPNSSSASDTVQGSLSIRVKKK